MCPQRPGPGQGSAVPGGNQNGFVACGKVALEPQRRERALFLGITGVQASPSEQCQSLLFPAWESSPNLEVPKPGRDSPVMGDRL